MDSGFGIQIGQANRRTTFDIKATLLTGLALLTVSAPFWPLIIACEREPKHRKKQRPTKNEDGLSEGLTLYAIPPVWFAMVDAFQSESELVPAAPRPARKKFAKPPVKVACLPWCVDVPSATESAKSSLRSPV